MKYLSWTYVDAQTGIPCLIAPTRNGPANPAVAGLAFGFALESRYPTAYPVFYGTCADDADTNIPGVLEVIDQAGYEAALAGEMTARRAKLVVTMRQTRRALLDAGLLDQVDAAIAAIADATERRQAEIDWEYATTVERLWPWVQTMGAALGLSAEALDALFELAATL